MTAYNVIDPGKLVAGQPEDVSVILANLQAIAATFTTLDNSNLSPAAAIAISKLAGYPADGSRVLLGDGTWGTVSGGGVGSSVPAGVIHQFGGAAAPSGYLLCDGAAVSRTTYAALFAVVGTLYGVGDGSTTFNLPDIRGRVPVGLGTNQDTTPLGQSDAMPVGSRSPLHNSTSAGFTLPNHVHGATVASHQHGISQVGGTVGDGPFVAHAPGGGGTPSATDFASPTVSVGNPTSNPPITGTIGPGGVRPDDMPAFIVFNYIIKT